MSAQHRPDFAAFMRGEQTKRDPRFRDAYLLPYMNLEDLCKPKILLLLLNARGRNAPDVFAMADVESCRFGHVSGAIVPDFLNEDAMMFTNRKKPETYGQLISWDENDKAFMWMHTGRGKLPGEGLLVLETQQRVLHFLVDCCTRILHDISLENLDREPISAALAMPSETADGYASLVLMAAEAPYRVPAALDWGRLVSLMSARMSAAEENIWALREDPGYFANALLEGKEHRQELIEDSNGQPHPMFKLRLDSVFWQRIIGTILAEAQLGLEVWTELHKQTVTLQALCAKYAELLNPEKDLPAEYLQAILKFQHYLDQAAKGPLGQMKYAVPASSPLRSWFVRDPPLDATSTKIVVRSKANLKLSAAEKKLMWLLQLLMEDGQQLFFAGMVDTVDELQHLSQTDDTVRKLVSGYVSDVIGDLVIVTESLRQINRYSPWAQTFENAKVDQDEAIKAEFAKTGSGWTYALRAMEGAHQAKIVELGTPTDHKFNYPVNKRRTKQVVEAMRAAEQALDAFWQVVDQNMNVKTKLINTALGQLLRNPRLLQRTPEWVEAEPKPKSNKENEIHAVQQPLSDLYFELEHRTRRTATDPNPSPPTKTKTRGQPIPSPQDPPPPPSSLPDLQPTFALDARALSLPHPLPRPLPNLHAWRNRVDGLPARHGSHGLRAGEAVRLRMAFPAYDVGCGAEHTVSRAASER